MPPGHLSHWAVLERGALCWNMGPCGHGWVCSGVSGNEKGTLALNLEKGKFGQENPEAGHLGYRLACVFVGKQLALL